MKKIPGLPGSRAQKRANTQPAGRRSGEAGKARAICCPPPLFPYRTLLPNPVEAPAMPYNPLLTIVFPSTVPALCGHAVKAVVVNDIALDEAAGETRNSGTAIVRNCAPSNAARFAQNNPLTVEQNAHVFDGPETGPQYCNLFEGEDNAIPDRHGVEDVTRFAVAANASSRLVSAVQHEAVEINGEVVGFDLDAVHPRWRIEVTF